jgi:hypothetical protein
MKLWKFGAIVNILEKREGVGAIMTYLTPPAGTEKDDTK